MKALRPFFILFSLILVVGLACSAATGGSPTAPTQAPQQPPAEKPTDVPQQEAPTKESPTAQAPTAEPAATEVPATEVPAASDYFTEEFDGNISNYTYFEYHELGTSKIDESVQPITKNSALVFDLKKANKWVYVTYEPYTYTDVRLDVSADNRGKNNNNVSLVCRLSEEGWYEFSIANNGLFWISAYISGEGYQLVYNGGSNLIKQGKDVNDYTFICSGDDLTVGINGTEVKTVTDTKYKLREGKVGFGVSSFDVLPILVNIDSFQVSAP